MYAHVFWSPFPAAYGHTYHVDVERSDGAETSVEAIVPPRTELVLQEPSASFPVTVPVLVEGEAPRLLKIEVTYGVDFKYLAPVEKFDTLTVSYDGRQARGADGWLIRINLSEDIEIIRDAIQQNGPMDLTYGILLTGITLRLIVASEDWDPPEGVFDPELLVQPGTLSNVENGFGFVGAGYRLKLTWLPPEEIMDAAGFRPRSG